MGDLDDVLVLECTIESLLRNCDSVLLNLVHGFAVEVSTLSEVILFGVSAVLLRLRTGKLLFPQEVLKLLLSSHVSLPDLDGSLIFRDEPHLVLGFIVDLSQGNARLYLDLFSAVLIQLLVVSVLLLQGLAFERPKVFFHVTFVSLPYLTLD